MAHHDCLYGHHGPQIRRGSRFGWEAVDQKRWRITAQAAVKKQASRRPAKVSEPKCDASVRTIQISDAFAEQLKLLPKRGGLIFSCESGDLISADYFMRQMHKAVKASSMEWRGRPAHTFRHFACSLFVQEFSNLIKV